jgi:hypothetical protein
MRTVARSGRVTAIVAAVLVVAGAAVWMVRRRGRTAA